VLFIYRIAAVKGPHSPRSGSPGRRSTLTGCIGFRTRNDYPNGDGCLRATPVLAAVALSVGQCCLPGCRSVVGYVSERSQRRDPRTDTEHARPALIPESADGPSYGITACLHPSIALRMWAHNPDGRVPTTRSERIVGALVTGPRVGPEPDSASLGGSPPPLRQAGDPTASRGRCVRRRG
jgi:hypothetical protein